MNQDIAAEAVLEGETSERAAGRVLHRHIPSLDGLRALSIIFVLIGHTGHQLYFDNANLVGLALDSLPGLGVKIFFVISGYLITLLLLSE
jgi:peptidoglycan/LPS O-acetylase OafA/YrhL